MPVGEVGVARRCAVATVPEQSADQGQVLAGHDGLTGGGVPKVVQALPAELGVRTDRAPADNKAVRIPAFSASFGNRNAPERRFPGSASMIARAALPSGTARGPVLVSVRQRINLICCKRTIIFVRGESCNQDECGCHQSSDPPWTQLAPDGNAVARGASVRSRGEGRDESAGAGASLRCSYPGVTARGGARTTARTTATWQSCAGAGSPVGGRSGRQFVVDGSRCGLHGIGNGPAPIGVVLPQGSRFLFEYGSAFGHRRRIHLRT